MYAWEGVVGADIRRSHGLDLGEPGPLGPCELSTMCYSTVYYADFTKPIAYYWGLGLSPSLIPG